MVGPLVLKALQARWDNARYHRHFVPIASLCYETCLQGHRGRQWVHCGFAPGLRSCCDSFGEHKRPRRTGVKRHVCVRRRSSFCRGIRCVRSRAHGRGAVLSQTLPSLLEDAIGRGSCGGLNGDCGCDRLRPRKACDAFAFSDMGRTLCAQDPCCATPGTHFPCLHSLLATRLLSDRPSRSNRDGNGGERVWRIRLVCPSFLPQVIAVPVRAELSHDRKAHQGDGLDDLCWHASCESPLTAISHATAYEHRSMQFPLSN